MMNSNVRLGARPRIYLVGAAEWPATGPENQGNRKVRGSIPPPSASLPTLRMPAAQDAVLQFMG